MRHTPKSEKGKFGIFGCHEKKKQRLLFRRFREP
jgi:hypothetical protein